MFQIAIDGHSGSGKSVLAEELAKRLGFHYLDTGAIYRGIACAFNESNFDKVNAENIKKIVSKLDVKIMFDGEDQHVVVNGKDYTPYLRTEEISSLASVIASYAEVRKKTLEIQRDFASKYNVVMEGRDIGSVVLPEAQVKIFLTADVKTRAERRFEQLSDKSGTSVEEVMADLIERDARDMTRKIAPLKVADGAIVLDNTKLTLQKTYDKAEQIVRKILKKYKKKR